MIFISLTIRSSFYKIKSKLKTVFKLSGIVILLFVVMLTACKKEADEVDVVPEITFVSVTPTTAKEFQDSLTFTISYKDGNGDLGENSPDTKNLFLTDNRIGITYSYRIQQLAPDNADIAIQGQLHVVLKNIAITDSSNQQQATFNINVTDRAGNKSNTVTSSVVTITK